MKVLFLQENGFYESIGIMSISAVLKAHGHECDLLIASEEKNLMQKIKDYNPDIVAFSLMTVIHEWALNFAKKLKKEMNVLTVFGGPHCTIFPETIEEPVVDILCIGEGEYAMLDLVNNLRDGKDITKIDNQI